MKRPAISFAWIALFVGCASGPEPRPIEQPSSVAPETLSQQVPAPLEEKTPAAEDKPVENQLPPVLEEDTARLLMEAGASASSDLNNALALVDKAISRQPACAPCFYDRGVLLEKTGKIVEAEAAYRQALRVFAGHRESAVNLSNLLLRQSRTEEALAVIASAANAAPRDLALRVQLAKIMIVAGKPQEGVEQLKGVLAAEERHVEAMVELAQAFHRMGKLELAQRLLLKAKSIDENDARIYNRLGLLYLDQKDNNSAIASFKKAVELDPNLLEARNNLGVMFSRAHDYEAAIEQFRAALAVDGTFFEAMLNLANALRGAQKFKEAEEAYRQALAIKPRADMVHCNLGLLYLDDEIEGYSKSQKYKLALEELRQCQQQEKLAKLQVYIQDAEKKYQRALKDEERRKAEEEKRRQQEARQREEEEKKRLQAEAAAQAQEQQVQGDKLPEGKEELDEKLPDSKGEEQPAGGEKLGGDEK